MKDLVRSHQKQGRRTISLCHGEAFTAHSFRLTFRRQAEAIPLRALLSWSSVFGPKACSRHRIAASNGLVPDQKFSALRNDTEETVRYATKTQPLHCVILCFFQPLFPGHILARPTFFIFEVWGGETKPLSVKGTMIPFAMPGSPPHTLESLNSPRGL